LASHTGTRKSQLCGKATYRPSDDKRASRILANRRRNLGNPCMAVIGAYFLAGELAEADDTTK